MFASVCGTDCSSIWRLEATARGEKIRNKKNILTLKKKKLIPVSNVAVRNQIALRLVASEVFLKHR